MTTDNQYYRRHQLSKISTDADQAELVALRFGVSSASAGVRDDIIADTIKDEFGAANFTEEAEWQTRETIVDTATSQIVDEVKRRAASLGNLYPFSITGDVIKYEQSENILYEFLLCTSLAPNLTTGKFRRLPRMFERVVTQLTADFLGPNTKFVHVGAPNERMRFKKAVWPAVEESREFRWRPDDDLPDEGPRSGDEGVDYILWKTYSCGRPVGQPFYFGQCACGNNWETKVDDIGERFFKWFSPLKVGAAKVFSVPFVVPEVKLREVAREAGIVLDRIRLMHSGALGVHFDPDAWRDELFEAMCIVAAD